MDSNIKKQIGNINFCLSLVVYILRTFILIFYFIQYYVTLHTK